MSILILITLYVLQWYCLSIQHSWPQECSISINQAINHGVPSFWSVRISAANG